MTSLEHELPLTLKHRPRRFQDMVGQKSARTLLMRMVQTEKVPPALLVFGAFGAGKTTSARIIAAGLNCEHEDPSKRPCGVCPTCDDIVNARSPDVIEIDAASNGRVEDIRELQQILRYQATARFRVLILDEAHELTTKAQQTLLKLLEEPPPRVVIILPTTNPDRLLDTISSRCFLVQFRKITTKDISSRLLYIARQEGISLSEEMALAIADRSRGAMRDAVMLLQQCSLVGASSPAHLSALLGDTNVSLRLVEALADGDYPTAYTCAQEGLESLPSPSELVSRIVVCMRRLLILSSLQGELGAIQMAPPPSAEELAVAKKIPALRLVSAQRVVWDYYSKVAPVADAFAAMDLLVTVLGSALSGNKSDTKSSAVVTPVSTSQISGSPPKTEAGSSSAQSVDEILASVRSQS